ncbi:MAG: S41 family peptidase [Limnohabitans sp.]|nr:S41 family peptidase [Limnohabitans sp.]
MKNINKIYFPLILFTAITVGFVLGALFIKTPTTNRLNSENLSKRKLNKLIDFINSEYIDSVNTDSIVDQTVTGILEKLDPHSIYLAKNEAKAEAENMNGGFVGIGVNFFIDKDTVVVISPLKNGPAEKAGVKSGDRILLANNHKVSGNKITTEKLYSILKGEPNSPVKLNIFRKSQHKKLNLIVYRNIVTLKSVDIAIMLNKTTGYIKINRFAESTYDEFKKGLTQIIKAGAKSLVLDLRDNGGGYMEDAILIADEFLKEKKLIVFTKNKQGKIDKTFATDEGSFENGKITVLINENSASASEILAGAIQDNDRGLIIGRRSFGKGLVQREIPFEDGSTVRLTVARYYTPTGRSIQKSYKNGSEQYFNDFLQRFHNGEMHTKDSIKIADTLKFKTPKGRIVYGGGGIVPDIFVPIESTSGNEIIPTLMQSGLVTNFVFREIDSNRKFFENLNFKQIISKIEHSDFYFEKFAIEIKKSVPEIDLYSNKRYIKHYLTAEFCRQLLDENKYYSILLTNDKMIQTALNAK